MSMFCFRKVLVVLNALAIFASIARAEHENEIVMAGGLSPDGQFSVCVARDDSRGPSNYVCCLKDSQGTRLLTLRDVGGYLDFENARERARAVWNEKSSFVAFADQGTKTSNTIFLLFVENGHAAAVSLPDWKQNALGRADATETWRTSWNELQSWEHEVLRVEFVFEPTSDRRLRSVVTLVASGGRGTAPNVRLKSVSHPEPVDL